MAVEFSNLSQFSAFLNQHNVFNKFQLERIGIFGSFARGEIANDIDILVDHIDLAKAKKLKDFLEQNSKTKFDVVVTAYANPVMLYRARQDLVYVQRY